MYPQGTRSQGSSQGDPQGNPVHIPPALHDLHDFQLPGDPIPNALDDGRCRLDLDPSVGFRAHAKASKSVSQFAG